MATVLAASINASADRTLDREFGADFSLGPKGARHTDPPENRNRQTLPITSSSNPDP
jgi:hypothetical protein